MREREPLHCRLSRIAGWLLVATVVGQFYTAGLGVFGAAPFTTHAVIGVSAILLAAALAILVRVARRESSVCLLAIGCVILAIAQPALIHAVRPHAPAVAALHPVVGLAIGVSAWWIATRRLPAGAASRASAG